MSRIYNCLISANGIAICIGSYLKAGRKVGNVGSDIALYSVKSEEEVLAGCGIKLLTANFNALDGYKCANVLEYVFACTELSGNIDSCRSFLLGIDNSCNSILKLIHTVVYINLTADSNGHTNLDAEFNGIGSHIVCIVTALAGCVNSEDVVSLVACGFRVKSNYDTFNSCALSIFLRSVLLVGDNVILRNENIKGECVRGAVACLNGSGKGEADVLCGFFVNVDNGGGSTRTLNDLNLGFVGFAYGPNDVIHNACNRNRGNTLKVSILGSYANVGAFRLNFFAYVE